jgi:hypothetical protein
MQGGQVPGAGFSPTPGFAGGGERGFSPMRMPMGEFGERGGMMGGGMPFRGEMGGGAGSFAPSGTGRTELPRGVDYWLVRFFDFTVQPGKKYKYRVQLVLADPNYGIPSSANMLDQSVLDRRTKEKKAKNFRFAAASEPSPAVGVPLQGGVRVAGAKLPSGKNPYEEPSVKLWAETVEIDNAEGTAIHVAKDENYVRGAVVNLHDKMFYTDVNKTWRDEFDDDHAINTNITVLDIEGADPVAKGKYAPTRVLLMDAAGELSIRDETDDSLAVMQLKAAFTERKGPRRPEDEMMPGGFQGGFPGGRGGPRGRN